MRSLEIMKKIDVIIRPITNRLDFSCFQASKIDDTVKMNQDTQDKDWNRYRYRRK